MISRYSRPVLEKIWNQTTKYETWLSVELAHLEVLAKEGLVPKAAFEAVKKKAKIDPQEIDRIEKEVKHDVIAFLTQVSKTVGPEARHLHYGLTSSDLVDTALSLQLKEATEIILEGMGGLLKVLKEKALAYKDVVTMGRSHGIHAEPTSFGLKFLLWYSEMKRNEDRLKLALETISVGKFSGAVGNFAYLSPQIEEKICKKLGLKAESISTQVISRDRHADFFSVLAIVAGSIEKIAVEIRHLQRTEVLEVEEPFSKGQKGSSAMPHKKNPILCENLTGLARLVRSYAQAALENIALWHERDISHSSVERVIAPDSTTLLDFMIHRLTGVLKDLVVYPHRMKENMDLSFGLVYSQRVLLALTQKGISREEAYQAVQKNALQAWESRTPFINYLLKDKAITSKLSAADIKACFDVAPYLKHVGKIYDRVLSPRMKKES